MQAYQKGTLISWKDDRGFGFIEPENGAKKVFLHISSLKKHGRRPQEGDTIYYQLEFDRQNRLQATHAYIDGVQYRTRSTHAKSSYRRREKKSQQHFYRIATFILIIIAIIAGGIYYKKQSRPGHSSSSSSSRSSSSSSFAQYTCQGKTRCTQMTSCAEATFYLKNCPGVEIDGDGDGIPCESQWCGH